MQQLYWIYETSTYRKGDISEIKISLRGSCELSQNIFELYVSGFVKKYRDVLAKQGPIETLHRRDDYSEYFTLVTLNISPTERIEYPGYNGR